MNDLVLVSLEPWDAVWRRNQYLVDRLLALDGELRVLFVEPPADPLHAARSRRRPSWGHGLRKAGDDGRLWTVQPTKVLPRRVDPWADRRLGRTVVAAAHRLGMSDPVLWLNDPRAARLMADRGERVLYDITDDWLSAARPAAERARLAHGERLLLSAAGEVVACSTELVRRKSPQRPAHRHPIVLIPNAVDTAAYGRAHSRPRDLPSGRTAVYAGTVHSDRFDVATTIATARALTGRGTVVLVGPNHLGSAATTALSAAGVVMLGARAPQDLVAYLQHADALIVPHVVNDFTDSLDPIKLYEYTAAGRQVVSTPVAGFRDSMDELVASVPAERFPDAVVAALSSTPESGTSHRDVPDWSDRARAMHDVLQRLRAADRTGTS